MILVLSPAKRLDYESPLPAVTATQPRLLDESERLIARLRRLAPAEIAFIDDRMPNVDGAAALGWQAHLWVDDADSLAWLAEVCGR